MSGAKEQKPDYARLRWAVLERDGWRCQQCGARSNLHVHHQVFRSQGGTDSTGNLIVLCVDCHRGLHLHESCY